MLSIEDYHYDLPKKLIAQQPAENREGSRLLVYNRKTKEIIDDHFYNISKYLSPETTIVGNNSKVEECRLIFGNKEIFVLKAANNMTVEALVRPGRRFKLGKTVELVDGLTAHVDAITDDGHRIITFSEPLDDDLITKNQHIPLPPYIEQNDSLKERYQTVYAKPLGSKAAPTAGLHFSNQLLDDLKKEHDFIEVTLHVGLGTFSPIGNDEIKNKKLHSEYFEISTNSIDKLDKAGHVTAIGTTTLRTLESASGDDGKIIRSSGDTDIFIQPGYNFKKVDSLITNFHLPESSLLMLIAAFMGYDEMHRVYKHAVDNEYRFFSFGDSMLIV